MRKKIFEDKNLSGIDKSRSEYRESKILYEDSKVLIVQVKNRKGFLYFTTDKQLPYWKYSNSEDNKFFFIVELDNLVDGYSPYLIRVQRYDVDVVDKYGDDVPVDHLKQLFPELKEIINQIIPEYNTLYYLNLIKQGDGGAIGDLLAHEPLISDVTFNKTSPKKSKVVIRFEDSDDFFKMFSDFDVDQDLWAVNQILSGPGHYDGPFYSNDYVYDDWKQGYLIREIPHQFDEKLFEIFALLDPNLQPKTNDWRREDDFCERASNILYDAYERQIDNILGEYTSLMNECKRQSALKDLESTFNNIFIRFGIVQKYMFSEYFTLVDILITLFEMYKPKQKNIGGLLNSLVENKNLGGWGDHLYDYDCLREDWDESSFNREVERSLDTILEKLSEDLEENKLSDLQKLINITKKYKLDTWYELPKDKGGSEDRFRIHKIDKAKMKLVVLYKKYDEKNNYEVEERSYTPEEFNNFLYNFEIFE